MELHQNVRAHLYERDGSEVGTVILPAFELCPPRHVVVAVDDGDMRVYAWRDDSAGECAPDLRLVEYIRVAPVSVTLETPRPAYVKKREWAPPPDRPLRGVKS